MWAVVIGGMFSRSVTFGVVNGVDVIYHLSDGG